MSNLRRFSIPHEPNGLHVVADVRGSGPAILFLHGYPLNRTIWRDQVAALDGWRRIAPDFRGMGASGAPDGGYSMAAYADDLEAILDALEIEQTVLCGLSMGGYVAFEFIRRWRARVSGLVLMDTRAEADTAEGKRGRVAAAALCRMSGVGAIADQMLPAMLAASTLRDAPELRERLRTMMAGTPAAGVIGALGAMKDRSDNTALLPTLAGLPTLVVVGEGDRITPPDLARRMAGAIPGARLEIVPRAGHLPPVEQPAATTEILRKFLRDRDAGSPGGPGRSAKPTVKR